MFNHWLTAGDLPESVHVTRNANFAKAATCRHLQPHATTCSLQPLAATCSQMQPLAACSHLQPLEQLLAATRPGVNSHFQPKHIFHRRILNSLRRKTPENYQHSPVEGAGEFLTFSSGRHRCTLTIFPASGCKWMQTAASGGWEQVAATGCKWLQVALSGCNWLQVVAQVAASGCKWLQVAASGCKLQVAASGCKLQVAACGCKWLLWAVAGAERVASRTCWHVLQKEAMSVASRACWNGPEKKRKS